MRRIPTCAAIVAAFLFASLLSANEPTDLRSKDPIVQAVQKTINGVVAIRVPRPGEKDMIGSGFIVDETGLIVTNRHVTGGKRFVKVKLNDGTDLTGEVVMADANQDLAIVRIQHKKALTALRLLGKDDLMLAEKIIAIGSPYGYDHTVSVGIISALNREIHMPNDYLMKRLIQHNAAINPGNSGGPLVNVNAEVIGINVAMRDGAQLIAFAIHADTVKEFLGKYSRQVSAVDHGLNVEEKIVAEMGDRQRVVVKHAAHADIKTGDEIVKVGELKVSNTFDFDRALWLKKPGQQVEVKVVRQGREVAVTLTLQANHGAGQTAAVSQGTSAESRQPAVTANVRSATQR
jgi:serine protease Do